ncbi:MAG TPA: phosphoadenylyl-sulfate reductase [Acidimicrobiia bacterium]|nr:phosphoadenylyl-sulfate reductase [Acidimicrobiia bacterium]
MRRGMTATAAPIPDLGQLADVSASLESAPASAVVEWAWDEYGDDIVLAASFQDCVLIDLAVQVAPKIEIVFLDTQYHFAETLWYVDEVRKRYDLNLRVMEPEIPPDNLWQRNTDACCALRKVEPLRRALDGKAAWMTGLRRDETPTRANSPIVSYDVGRGMVKVNPLATWNDLDVEGYIQDRSLPVHPLAYHGYRSIGCWPCSHPVGDGEDPRAGRWAGTDKIECGLHT